MFRWFNLALEAATLIKQAIVDFCSLAGGSSETYQWSMDRDDSSLSLDHHYTIRLTGCYRMAARPPRAIGHFCDHPLAPDSTSIAPAPGEGNGAPATSLVPNAADFTTWYDVTWRWWAAVVGWPQREIGSAQVRLTWPTRRLFDDYILKRSGLLIGLDWRLDYVIIIISNYIKVRPKASRTGFVCRTDQYFQRQRLTYTCRLKTVKSVR